MFTPTALACVIVREKAERLAKLSVSDPILYAIERRREANEINETPVGTPSPLSPPHAFAPSPVLCLYFTN